MKDLELKTISASKLRLYLQCARQYYYAYAENIFQKETKATCFGSYIHSALEDYVKHLIKTNTFQDLETLYSIASHKKKEYPSIEEIGSHSFFEADIILNKFASKKYNPQQIYAVEKFFELPFVDDTKITGRIDRIDIEDGKTGEKILHIIDYKTGKNMLTESALMEDIQMKFYTLGAYLLYRKLYKQFRFTLYYLRDNTQLNIEIEYTNEYFNELAHYIQNIKKDNSFEKSIGRHCLHCPALKVCKPDKDKI